MAATTRTDGQTGSTDSAERPPGREAFVSVFPISKALPVPLAGEACGRDWLAEHGISDPKSSRRHFALQRSRGLVHLTDLGSKNGTWVDGKRVSSGERVVLRDGCVVRIARSLFVYRNVLRGPDEPSSPMGKMASPFGLRPLAEELDLLGQRTPRNVLIEGETGTGKELLAEVVADRLGRPLVAVNMAAVPASVFEASLFGHVEGAFTGSGRGSKGLLLQHDRGAVLLDEIGELPRELQPKLLRFLENREFLPVGATRPVHVDVVVIAATNRSLREMVEQGSFRRDLLTRLEQWVVCLPALRDRPEDMLAITEALLSTRGLSLDFARVDPEALERLMLARWEGNVRELANVLERAVPPGGTPALRLPAVEAALGPRSTADEGSELTSEAVDRALAVGGNKSEAARILGVSRGKLVRFLRARGDSEEQP